VDVVVPGTAADRKPRPRGSFENWIEPLPQRKQFASSARW
jgi:hypothetical protein